MPKRRTIILEIELEGISDALYFRDSLVREWDNYRQRIINVEILDDGTGVAPGTTRSPVPPPHRQKTITPGIGGNNDAQGNEHLCPSGSVPDRDGRHG